jgi:predicted Zn finger-like uncharacterized protein
MSYTTRCPACGTMFKVVPDQLKISDGWVRCGHCADVFDATLHLETWVPPAKPVAEPPQADQPAVEAGTPGGNPAPAQGEVTASMPLRPPAGLSIPPKPERTAPSAPADTQPTAPAVRAGTPPADAPVAGPQEPDFLTELQRFAARSLSDPPAKETLDSPVRELPVRVPKLPRHAPSTPPDGAPAAALSGSDAPSRDAVQPDESGRPAEDASAAHQAFGEAEEVPAEPEFVLKARRKAYWETPAMRAALVSAVLLLALLWSVQWGLHERNRLVAWKPSLQPVLETACSLLGCALEPLRSIDDIVIDSTALVRRLGNFHSFDLVLKNTANLALAVPALELTLTDAAGNVISRRVFLPQDMPGVPPVLTAGGSVSVSLRLSIAVGDSMPMSGYRALVFYP